MLDVELFYVDNDEDVTVCAGVWMSDLGSTR